MRTGAILATAFILWMLGSCELAGGERVCRPRHSPRSVVQKGRASRPAWQSPARYQPTDDDRYSKYYGSFHYRHLDNIGVPSGDIGLRGNGLYWSAW
jgi:hypothetical protein